MPDLMKHIAGDYGFDAYDFEEAFGACDGYVIDSTMSLRSAWEPLELAFGFDLIETGGIIKAISRKAIPVRAAIDQDGLHDGNGDEAGELVTLTRAQESELARAVRITFLNANKAYNSGTVTAWVNFTGAQAISESQLAIVMDEDRAQSVAEYLLNDVWAARETGKFSLMPSSLALEPGDVVKVTTDRGSRDLRLTSVNDGEGRDCEASGFIDASLSISGSNYSLTPSTKPKSVSKVLARFLDLPLLKSSHDPNAGYVAMFADPWPGVGLMLRSQTESGWETNASVSSSAIIGETLTDFAKGPLYVFDRVNALDIEIYGGELESVEELDVLAGSNAFAIQNDQGAWEIIQAQTCELIGTNRYRLSKLIRGQRGTESAMLENTAAGAAVVYLGSGVAQVDMSLSDLNKSYYWRFGPVGEAVGSDRFTTQQHAFKGLGLKPFAPCHGKIKKSGTDQVISWIRRSRSPDAESWDLYKVPLMEEVEAYEVDILSGGAVVRTFEASGTAVTYVGGVLEECGIRSTRSAGAKSYYWNQWGQVLSGPCVGAIVVFWRKTPNGKYGHVGIVVGRDRYGNLMVLGGNQGDTVSIKPFSVDRVVSYHYPNGHKPGLIGFQNLPIVDSDGVVSTNEA